MSGTIAALKADGAERLGFRVYPRSANNKVPLLDTLIIYGKCTCKVTGLVWKTSETAKFGLQMLRFLLM